MDAPYLMTTDTAARRVRVSGTLDEVSTPRFRADLEDFAGDRERVVVDLSDVEYLLSAAVAALASAQQQASEDGRELSFVAAPRSIAARVMAICGIPFEAPGDDG